MYWCGYCVGTAAAVVDKAKELAAPHVERVQTQAVPQAKSSIATAAGTVAGEHAGKFCFI